MADRSGGARWSSRPADGLIRNNARLVELGLTLAVLMVTAALGLFLVVATEISHRVDASVDGPSRWLPGVVLLVALGVGGGGAARGHRRGRAMAPWAFAGFLLWIVGAVVAITQR